MLAILKPYTKKLAIQMLAKSARLAVQHTHMGTDVHHYCSA